MTSWLPLATAVIAAISALTGVLLSNYLSRRDKASELAFRLAQETRDFLINRGEALYVQLEEMDEFVAAHCRLIQRLCNGHIDFDHYKVARRESWGDRGKFEPARIKLAVRAYFPALQPLHAELASNLERLNEIDRALMEARTHDASLLVRANADAIRLHGLVTKAGRELRAELARTLAETFRSRTTAATTDSRTG